MRTLPLRPARGASRWFATPVVRPPDIDLAASGRPRIYLAPLDSRVDARILQASLEAAELPAPRWLPSRRRQIPEAELRDSFLAGDPVLLPLAPPRRGPDRLARLLAWACQEGCELDLVPLEVLWGPTERPPSLWNVLLGNPYEPPEWRRPFRVRRRARVRLIVGRPGTLGALRAEAPEPNDALALASYVRGQAVKALSQTERQVFGDRYKVPRLVVEEILGEASFRDRAAAAGAALGLTRGESLAQAERGLRELVTSHSHFAMELLRRFVRWLQSKVYEPEIAVEPAELERLRELGRHTPLVFVPSHKSNFDHLVLYALLFDAGFPPPHTAAGINMSFFPMGWVLPRTGAYFIRRSFQDDPVYKECLRAFITYLVKRRFHQEFFIEGGRTRSGKLLPPRYGMLGYVVDAVRENRVEEVCFVPTAIAYDQLVEVGDYVREQLGEEKERESFGFLVRMIRSLRRRQLGRVYVRFAEPIGLRRHVERSGDRLVVEKLAFQIARGINQVTPLTAVSAVCSALLGAGRRALTLPELEARAQRLIEYAVERGILLAPELERGSKVAVESATGALRRSRVIQVYDEGLETVYHIAPEARNVASYYRNTVVHFFVARAIASLARGAVREGETAEDWALRIRDLLKFEFFFGEREEFRREIERELEALAREAAAGIPPLDAAGPRIVLDYIESYWVVTQTLLAQAQDGSAVAEPELLRRCLAVGRQLLLQNAVAAPELLSSVNFRNALKLTENLGAVARRQQSYSVADARALSALARDLGHLARVARA